MEVTNRYEGLDLIVHEELCTNICDIVQEAVIKTIPKNAKIQSSCLRPYKKLRKEQKQKAKEKRKDTAI